MTQYDPHKWTSHLFDIEGSMVREILGRVGAAVMWSVAIVMLFHFYPKYGQYLLIPVVAHSLIGTALGLLLVFRTNSSYDRFWEGRKQWGGIVNECRNLTRQTSSWLLAEPLLVREVIDWTVAFPFAVMQRLRMSTVQVVPFDGLPAADVAQVSKSGHAPLAVARIMTARLHAARQRNVIDGLQLASLDQNIQLLIDYCGACERIRATPLPFAYAVHLRRILIVYCFTLPFALVKDFGWATIPTTLLVSYSLFGIEEIGVEIEDPFGVTTNDLPLETICDGISTTLREVRDSV